MIKAFTRFIKKSAYLYGVLRRFQFLKFWYPFHWTFDVLRSYVHFKKDIFFIQIGSNNGVNRDPLHHYVMNMKWNGILVEPVHYIYEELKRNYRNAQGVLNYENCAIGNASGEKPFYRLKKGDFNDLPTWYDQIGSLNAEIISKYKNLPHFNELFFEDKVIVKRFDEIIQKYEISKVDVLHIDTEGNDYEIIQSIDFDKVYVGVILFEHIHMNDNEYRSCIIKLKKNGYLVRTQNGSDTLAIKNLLYKELNNKL